MAGLSFKISSDRVRTRLLATLKRLDPDSPEARAFLFKAGTILRGYAIENLTNSGAVDTGLLRSSIQFTVESNGSGVTRLLVHTSGRRYARIVELGGAFTEAMRRAMFAKFRQQGRRPRPGKGIVGGGRYRKRPYMSPAAQKARPQLLQELKRLTTGQANP